MKRSKADLLGSESVLGAGVVVSEGQQVNPQVKRVQQELPDGSGSPSGTDSSSDSGVYLYPERGGLRLEPPRVRFRPAPTQCLEYSRAREETREEDSYSSNPPSFPSPSSDESRKRLNVHFPEGDLCHVREFVPEGEESLGEEYRLLQEQLRRMKEVCDRLKQTNLRQDLEQLQSSMARYERTNMTQNVTQLRERYKAIQEMIADAQRADHLEQGSFFGGGRGEDWTECTDLTISRR